MKTVSVSGSLRANVGKKDAKAVREAGRVPCILYGGKEQIAFSVAYNDLLPVVYTPETLAVEINVDGKTSKSLIQEIQFHPVSDRILHIDFLEMFDNKEVVVEIPIKVTGNSIGVKAGGKLVNNVRKLRVKALPPHLPDAIEIKVDDLDIGQSVRVADISLPNVTLLDTPNMVVTTVRVTRNVVAAGAEGAASAAGAPAPAKAPAKK